MQTESIETVTSRHLNRLLPHVPQKFMRVGVTHKPGLSYISYPVCLHLCLFLHRLTATIISDDMIPWFSTVTQHPTSRIWSSMQSKHRDCQYDPLGQFCECNPTWSQEIHSWLHDEPVHTHTHQYLFQPFFCCISWYRAYGRTVYEILHEWGRWADQGKV